MPKLIFSEFKNLFNEIKNNPSSFVGDHGNWVDVIKIKSCPALSEFYQKNQSLLSQQIYFWKTGISMPEFAIHRDSTNAKDVQSSLLFGLENCDEETLTQFYDNNNDLGKIDPNNGILFPKNPNHLNLMTEFSVLTGKVYGFNNNSWHRVINKGGKQRLVASWWALPQIDINFLSKNITK